jgi:hypothetical protein
MYLNCTTMPNQIKYNKYFNCIAQSQIWKMALFVEIVGFVCYYLKSSQAKTHLAKMKNPQLAKFQCDALVPIAQDSPYKLVAKGELL